MVMAETQNCQCSVWQTLDCSSATACQDTAVCVSLPSNSIVKEQAPGSNLPVGSSQIRFQRHVKAARVSGTCPHVEVEKVLPRKAAAALCAPARNAINMIGPSLSTRSLKFFATCWFFLRRNLTCFDIVTKQAPESAIKTATAKFAVADTNASRRSAKPPDPALHTRPLSCTLATNLPGFLRRRCGCRASTTLRLAWKPECTDLSASFGGRPVCSILSQRLNC